MLTNLGATIQSASTRRESLSIALARTVKEEKVGSQNRYFASKDGVCSIILSAISSYDPETCQVNGSKKDALSIFAMASELTCYLKQHASDKYETAVVTVFAYVLHQDTIYQKMSWVPDKWHAASFKISQLFALLHLQGRGSDGLLNVYGAANWIPLTSKVLVSARWSVANKGWYLNLVRISSTRSLQLRAGDQIISIGEL